MAIEDVRQVETLLRKTLANDNAERASVFPDRFAKPSLTIDCRVQSKT
jgi:hypothetical protein